MRKREREAIAKRIDKSMRKADATGKSATVAQADGRERDAARRTLAAQSTRAKVATVRTVKRTVLPDGTVLRNATVTTLTNPAAERAAAREGIASGKANRGGGKRDIYQSAGTRKAPRKA